MLRELYELSHHFEKPALGYSKIGVMWAIELRNKAPYLQKLTSKDKKGKEKDGKKLLVPDLRRNNDKALLIDDGTEYVFGIGERGERRHKLYWELLQQCIDATQDEGAKLVRDFIQNCDIEAIDSQVSEEIPPPKDKQGNPKERDRFWWYRDRIIFLLDSQPVTQRPAIQAFWAEYYSQEQGTTPGTCLLTGEDRPTIRDKMPAMVKGVPNTQSSGAAIVSFDKAAYQAYGWDGNTNAPIGFVPAVAIHQTLDILLKDQAHYYRLGNQTFLFWGDRQAEGIDPQLWDDPAASMVQGLFKATDKNSPSLPSKRARSRTFYLAVLKGNKGRIAVSYWDERSTEKLTQSLRNFIDCQKLTDSDRALPIWRLRNAAFREPNKEHTDRIDLALVRSALFGEALPENFAIKVIDRICQEQDTMRSLDRAKALAFYCQTIGAFVPSLCSIPDRANAFADYCKNTMNSNSETKSNSGAPRSEVFAYYLGRIAFLMHQAQYIAQKLVNSSSSEKTNESKKDGKSTKNPLEDTNVSRSLRALSTTPGRVFASLYEGCITNHLEDRQAQKKYGGTLNKIKKRLDKEFADLKYNPSDLPTTFNTREQAQFFLGFGTARAEYWAEIASQKSKAEDSE